MLFSKILEDEKLFEEYLKELEDTINLHREAMVSIRLDLYDIRSKIDELESKIVESSDNEEKKELIREIIDLEDEEDALWDTYLEIKEHVDELIEELEDLYELKEGLKEVNNEVEAQKNSNEE